MRLPVQIKHILFATDFSVYSERARDYALAVAKKFRARIYVLHAIEVVHYMHEDPELREWLRSLERSLEDRLARELAYFQDYGIDAEGELIIGSPWRVIVTFAKEKRIDLIVMGTHGVRTLEGKVLLGTTSHKVALAASVPVMLVRPYEEASLLTEDPHRVPAEE